MKIRIILPVLALTVLAACSSTVKGSSKIEAQQQANISGAIINNQPLPGITFSQLRQNLIEIEQAQAQSTQTTTFFFNQGVTDPTFVCPSIGFAIPNTASLSNPQQVIYASGNVGVATGGQMDPNGVFTPTSSTGTYVICVGGDGKAFADYWEGFVQTVTGLAHWDAVKHVVVMEGSSSFPFSTKKG